MDSTEWARVEEAIGLLDNLNQVTNLLSPNADKAAKELEAEITAADASVKSQLQALRASFTALRSTAKDVTALWKKMVTSKGADQTSCADAKAYHAKYNKSMSCLDGLLEFGTAYVYAVVEPANVAKFKKDKSLKGAGALKSTEFVVKAQMMRYMVSHVESYEGYYRTFTKLWDALPKPAATPSRPSAVTPTKPSTATPAKPSSATPAKPANAGTPAKPSSPTPQKPVGPPKKS